MEVQETPIGPRLAVAAGDLEATVVAQVTSAGRTLDLVGRCRWRTRPARADDMAAWFEEAGGADGFLAALQDHVDDARLLLLDRQDPDGCALLCIGDAVAWRVGLDGKPRALAVPGPDRVVPLALPADAHLALGPARLSRHDPGIAMAALAPDGIRATALELALEDLGDGPLTTVLVVGTQ